MFLKHFYLFVLTWSSHGLGGGADSGKGVMGPCLEDGLAAFWREMGQGYRSSGWGRVPMGDQTERVDAGLVGQNAG